MRMHSQGVMVKSSPSPPPAFVRISDKDLTEIELHSVDSISDLHRTHTEQHTKGVRPPRPQPPSTNGNLQPLGRPVVFQTGHQRRSHLNQLSSVCIPARRQYCLVCVAIILILLTLILVFSFLVQQSSALHRLSEVVRQRQEAAEELSLLIQELQALRKNLTTPGNTH